jgi:large subunit ribosomal protein L30e|tara:strand:- start:167 stop:427 length:261 start_codon:yes stop_codon:yes gene_type:complete
MSLENLKNLVKEKKIKVGSDETIKSVRNGTAKEVFISSNCQKELKEKLVKYGKIAKCEINILKEDSKDLGAICKKPFSINMCFSEK